MDMAQPDTFWLTLTNIVVGAVVLLFFVIIGLGALCGALSELRKRRLADAELTRDMHEMFAPTHLPVTPPHKHLEAACRVWRAIIRPRG